MRHFSVEDFQGKIDSLYRLVIIASRRAIQINRPDSRFSVASRSKKPTIVALDEVMDGKVSYAKGSGDEEDYIK